MKARQNYYREILYSMFVYMLDDPANRAVTISKISDALCSAKRDVQQPKLPNEPDAALVLGNVFHQWFRDPKYLTRKADPRALPLRGKKDSIESILRAQGLRGDALKTFLSEVVRLGLVRKTSTKKYMPLGQVAVFKSDGAALTRHIGASFTRLMSTFRYNTHEENRGAPLVERTAWVIDLPEDEVAAFREFTQAQAKSFLASVDDWLENHRLARSATKRRIRVQPAGVHVYAYLCS